jgi:hypothetical protein
LPTCGGSSASAFLLQIKLAIAQSDLSIRGDGSPLTDVEPVGNRNGEILPPNRLEIVRNQDIKKFVLPPRETADNLLNCYWEYSHPVFPVLHRPTFMARYAKLWVPSAVAGEADDDEGAIAQTIFHVTLNVVFAIGCQFTAVVGPAARSRYGNEFYQRSRKLANFEILDAVQLAIIQYFLLTAVYLYYEQPAEYADRCWNVVGLAVRASQALGLHLDQKTAQISSQLAREMNRRVWHCAIMLDRFVQRNFSDLVLSVGG